MCARHSLLPKSLQFELPGGKTGDVRHYGGYADVLKRGCGEREVAIKALRARDPKLEALTNRFYKEVIAWKSLRHPNILPLLGVIMSENQFAMVSEWMTNGNIKEFTAANQHANRYQLLAEVANGLKHMHNQEMVHGNLTGVCLRKPASYSFLPVLFTKANILIDATGRARLAGFGLLTIASDGANTNSYLEGGTSRWMSPELFDPEKFGLKDCRPTKSSDRYAFGMVMYEVLSGEIPFSGQHGFAFVVKVLNGERPTRPEGVKGMWFTDGIWSILEGLWKPNPGDRSLIKEALDLLEEASRVWTPPPPQSTAGPPSIAPSTRNSESSTEESIDESEDSASQMILPQPSQRSRSEGNPKRTTVSALPLTIFQNFSMASVITIFWEQLQKIWVDRGNWNEYRIGRHPVAPAQREIQQGTSCAIFWEISACNRNV
ncbi:kinase-like domain-containing protein [Thelephora terrestris]|uniref:Kinase-like domain-containing protein n=1 Tax=Thelephora terrestris TaxID=56493 RepID=A0A9P6HLS8_9AGAM|nr:kinase-like domain-containing protein [Thelephora terrestris]